MEIARCPVCSAPIINAPKLTRSRPRVYCSIRCRRRAEQERRRERQAARQAEYVARLPPPMREFWAEVDRDTARLSEIVKEFEDLGEIFDLKKSREALDRLVSGRKGEGER